MPFTAIDKDGVFFQKGWRFGISGWSQEKLHKIARFRFYCTDPLCDGKVKLYAITSKHKRPYFSHLPNSGSGKCRVGNSGGKSAEHDAAQNAIIELYSHLPDVEITEYEYIDQNIRADVAVFYRDGRKICHEYERSNLDPESLHARTEQRQALGWEVVWWFNEMRGERGWRWCHEHHDLYGLMTFEKRGELIVAHPRLINAKIERQKRQERKGWAEQKRRELDLRCDVLTEKVFDLSAKGVVIRIGDLLDMRNSYRVDFWQYEQLLNELETKIKEFENERMHPLRQSGGIRQEGQVQNVQEAGPDIQPRQLDEYYKRIEPRKPKDLEDKKDYVLGSEFSVWLIASKLFRRDCLQFYDELKAAGHSFIDRGDKRTAVVTSLDYISLEHKLILNGTGEKWAKVKANMLS